MQKEIVEEKLITPAEAKNILESSCFSNRSLNERNVGRLVRSMLSGNYYGLYSEPLAITKAGELINGQHRLTAIVRSGVSQKMLVLTNADREAFRYLDNIVKPRTNADVLKIDGQEHYSIKATAFNILSNYDSGRSAGESNDIIGYEIIDLIDAYGENHVSEYAKISSNIYSDIKLSKAVSLAVFLAAMESKKDSLDILNEFANQVRGLAKTSKGDPGFELRNFVEENRRLSKERGGTELTRDFKAVTIAWNKFLADAEIKSGTLKKLVEGSGKITVGSVTDYISRT